MKNTKDKGIVEFVMFEEHGRYVAACLTFDIVLEGDDATTLKEQIIAAARLHLDTVEKLNLPETLLNRPAPKEYWDKRGQLLDLDNRKALRQTFHTGTYSRETGLFV